MAATKGHMALRARVYAYILLPSRAFFFPVVGPQNPESGGFSGSGNHRKYCGGAPPRDLAIR